MTRTLFAAELYQYPHSHIGPPKRLHGGQGFGCFQWLRLCRFFIENNLSQSRKLYCWSKTYMNSLLISLAQLTLASYSMMINVSTFCQTIRTVLPLDNIQRNKYFSEADCSQWYNNVGNVNACTGNLLNYDWPDLAYQKQIYLNTFI